MSLAKLDLVKKKEDSSTFFKVYPIYQNTWVLCGGLPKLSNYKYPDCTMYSVRVDSTSYSVRCTVYDVHCTCRLYVMFCVYTMPVYCKMYTLP